MTDFWDFIKGLGALVGLVTGAFVLWERFSRESPSMFIVALPYSISGKPFPYLRVINPSKRPLILSWKVGILQHEFTLRTDLSTRAIIASLLPGRATATVNGGAEKDFPITNPRAFDTIAPDNAIELHVHWRLAQPLVYQMWRKRRVTIIKKFYENLLDGSNRSSSDDL